MENKRKPKLAIVLAALACILCVGGISAYLISQDQKVNQVTVGECKIKVVEEFTPPEELKPGISFTKDVKAVNLGPNDSYVRIKAVFTDGNMKNYCSVNYNTTDFDYNEKDWYYYYKNVLKDGEKTPSLFTTVSIAQDAPQAELKDFDILVYTENYQSEGFASYSEAWAHFKKNKPAV